MFYQLIVHNKRVPNCFWCRTLWFSRVPSKLTMQITWLIHFPLMKQLHNVLSQNSVPCMRNLRLKGRIWDGSWISEHDWADLWLGMTVFKYFKRRVCARWGDNAGGGEVEWDTDMLMGADKPRRITHEGGDMRGWHGSGKEKRRDGERHSE